MDPAHPTTYDPLRFCVFTTIALLAWVLSPPVVVALTGGVGLLAYARARRQGLLRSRCALGDTRIVMAYLGAACCLGFAFTLRSLMR